MVLRFELNTICTCSLTRYFQRYTEFENYLDICATLQTVFCAIMTYNVKSHYDIQGDSQCFSE